MPRILILTAGFGEGHNTAARCTREAILELAPGAEVRIFDPISAAFPLLTKLAQETYISVINHMPMAWKCFYDLADRADGGARGQAWLAPVKARLAGELHAFEPEVVVTTYPVYTGFWGELFPEGTPPPCPLHTVVTDSITVNAIWARGRSTTWCVTDPITAGRVADLGVPPDRIRITGFPVSPRIATLPRPLAPPSGDQPFRLLYMPIASKRHTTAVLSALRRLPATPAWSATIVLGKQKDKLRPMIEAAIADGTLPASSQIIGWTDQIPELLNTHHVVLGKSGGATLHESRTAARPMLIHYMVPGQEEGNALLLESEGGGFLLPSIGDLPARWAAWTENHFAGWTAAHRALLAATTADPAHQVARLVLQSIRPTI